MEKLKSFTEFQEAALRTESQVESAETNVTLVKFLLGALISITEVLDAVKKQVFYGNDKKLLENTRAHLAEAAECIQVASACDLHVRHPLNINLRAFHGMLGVITESGEIAEHLLNHTNGEELDVAGVMEECADGGGWYTAVLCDEFDVDYYQVLTNCIEKLKVRFPDKFTNENALNRNLDAERAELEKGFVAKSEENWVSHQSTHNLSTKEFANYGLNK